MLEEGVLVGTEELGEDAFQNLNDDGVPGHLVLLAFGNARIADFVNIWIADSHQAKTLTGCQFPNSVNLCHIIVYLWLYAIVRPAT